LYDMPLVMLPEGAEGRVSRVHAGRGLCRRLIEMGFTENAVVSVLGQSERGAVIVKVNGSKYALSRGMAMKIMVKGN